MFTVDEIYDYVQVRVSVCLFVCITDRSKWTHADGPDKTSLDKMPKHDFKRPIACWPKPLSTNKVNNNSQPVD